MRTLLLTALLAGAGAAARAQPSPAAVPPPQTPTQVRRPAAGDSLGPLSVRVRSRDAAGAVSSWRTHPEWWLRTDALPPPPPGEIRTDTATVAITEVFVLPQQLELTAVGEQTQLCGYARYSDGTIGMDPYTMYCQQLLDAHVGLPPGESPLAQRRLAFSWLP